jgi:hypothetical protein
MIAKHESRHSIDVIIFSQSYASATNLPSCGTVLGLKVDAGWIRDVLLLAAADFKHVLYI